MKHTRVEAPGHGGHPRADGFFWDSPASEDTSEPKEGTFSRGPWVLLFGVSQKLRGGAESREMNAGHRSDARSTFNSSNR